MSATEWLSRPFVLRCQTPEVSLMKKLIIAGASAYPRAINFAAFREIADEVGEAIEHQQPPTANGYSGWRGVVVAFTTLLS